MAVVKCKNGHWYDSGINDSCPHCKRNSEKLSIMLDNVEEDDKTVSIMSGDIFWDSQLDNPAGRGSAGDADMGRIPAEESASVEEDDRTISFGFLNMVRVSPVVGWLICLTGDEMGKDFRLKSGRNFIGRSSSMDVMLVDDKSIAREKHGCVTYDPKGNAFYITPEGGNTIYVDGRLIQEAKRLRENNKIRIGETVLIFVPFCKEGRKWKGN